MKRSPSHLREGLGVGVSFMAMCPVWPTPDPSRLQEGRES